MVTNCMTIICNAPNIYLCYLEQFILEFKGRKNAQAHTCTYDHFSDFSGLTSLNAIWKNPTMNEWLQTAWQLFAMPLIYIYAI